VIFSAIDSPPVDAFSDLSAEFLFDPETIPAAYRFLFGDSSPRHGSVFVGDKSFYGTESAFVVKMEDIYDWERN
jgi:hypothetical protein